MKKYVYTVIGMMEAKDAERVVSVFRRIIGEEAICRTDTDKMQVEIEQKLKRHKEEAIRLLLEGDGYELMLPAGAWRFTFEGEKKKPVCVPLWLTCLLVCAGIVFSALITFVLTGGYI